MQNHDYNTEALELHKKYGGKLETVSKVRLGNRDDLSRAYSPGVAEVCREISKREMLGKENGEGARGSEAAARDYTLKKNTVAIISDGSAILGLGNLGSYSAIPVMEGKAAILKEFANVDAFPICLDTQDTEEIINIIKNIAPVFGGINLEDIASPKCFEIEERLRAELNIPVMHDDQWGAATVALTALINSCKLTDRNEKEKVKIVLSGVGAAGVATARLLISYGYTNIIFVDSVGIINRERKEQVEKKGNKLNKEKLELLENTDEHNISGGLSQAVKNRDVFIGLSKPNVLTGEMVKSMNTNPIIFALANPSPEISVEEALASGARIVATGRSDYPNQINNSLVFPGFWRGVLDAQCENRYAGIDNNIFIKIAKDLADYTEKSEGGLSENKILPDMFDREVVKIVSDSFK